MIITGTGNKTYLDLLKKSPEQYDVFQLVRDIAPSWHELGGLLRISYDMRDSLHRDPRLTVSGKLEHVLNYWIASEPSPVTWEMILQALKALQREDFTRNVIAYLETPDVYSTYIEIHHIYTCMI